MVIFVLGVRAHFQLEDEVGEFCDRLQLTGSLLDMDGALSYGPLWNRLALGTVDALPPGQVFAIKQRLQAERPQRDVAKLYFTPLDELEAHVAGLRRAVA